MSSVFPERPLCESAFGRGTLSARQPPAAASSEHFPIRRYPSAGARRAGPYMNLPTSLSPSTQRHVMTRVLKPKSVDVKASADPDSAAPQAWAGETTGPISDQRSTEDALREADRHKSEFLAWLSHELRNPLGIIRTSLALIERTGVESETGRKAVAVISR